MVFCLYDVPIYCLWGFPPPSSFYHLHPVPWYHSFNAFCTHTVFKGLQKKSMDKGMNFLVVTLSNWSSPVICNGQQRCCQFLKWRNWRDTWQVQMVFMMIYGNVCASGLRWTGDQIYGSSAQFHKASAAEIALGESCQGRMVSGLFFFFFICI